MGDPPNGIYVIVKGMVKVNFVPTMEIMQVSQIHLNCPKFKNLLDFFD
jgi:hypothetical protein